MSLSTELNEIVSGLQASLDAEQEQVRVLVEEKNKTIEAQAANIVTLNALIDELRASSLTEEEKQALIAKANDLKLDLENTIVVEVIEEPTDPTEGEGEG